MDKNKFKEMTFGQKAQYIWEYYKIPIFGIILGIITIVILIVGLIRKDPEVVLNVCMVNANQYQVAEEDVFDRYLKEQGYNPQTQTIQIKGNYKMGVGHEVDFTSFQAINTAMSMGQLDLIIGDETVFLTFGTGRGFKSLSEILTPELMEKYEDQLYTVLDDETKEPVICGIWLPKENELVKDGYYKEGVLVGVPYSVTNQELATEMLLYLLEN